MDLAGEMVSLRSAGGSTSEWGFVVGDVTSGQSFAVGYVTGYDYLVQRHCPVVDRGASHVGVEQAGHCAGVDWGAGRAGVDRSVDQAGRHAGVGQAVG